MDPVTVGALVSAGGQALTATGGYLAAKKNRKWQTEQNEVNFNRTNAMYDKARNDALADREYENAYNSPQQQMQRLKEAGLNPHLVYGNGTVAEGASTRSTSAQTQNAPAPQMDSQWIGAAGAAVTNLALGYANLSRIQAETDNLRAQKELTEANTRNVGTNTTRTEYDLDVAKQQQEDLNKKLKLENDNIAVDTDKKTVEVHKTVQDMDLDLQANEREKIRQTLQNGKITAETTQIYQDMAKKAIEIEIAKAESRGMHWKTEILQETLNNIMEDTQLKQAQKYKIYSEGDTQGDPTRIIADIIKHYTPQPIIMKK